jgi:hypothetical protein
MATFMFATGIENSYPTIQAAGTASTDGALRPLQALAHDFDLVEDLGIPLSCAIGRPSTSPGSADGRYDWASATRSFGELEAARPQRHRRPLPFRRAGLGRQFPEPDFPALFAAYARALPSASLGPALHANQRECSFCAQLLRASWLVERAAVERPGR